MSNQHPNVLTFSGHDPSGGAGVQADIETLISHRCHPVSIITALTEQDTRNIVKLVPQNPEDIASQAATLLADVPIKAIKIGLTGDSAAVYVIHKLLKQHPGIPVVFDPVLAAGGGADLSSENLIALINELLLPCTTILTPNSEEARRLTGLHDLEDCGLNLLDKGCAYVLITGTHENTPQVSNRLFHAGGLFETYSWNRLPHSYHGSGCTLSASIAALLAQGLDVEDAVSEAQEFTWNALASAYRPGKGQHNPDRLFWATDE